MRRPWFIAVTAFVVVLGLGGFAFAANGVFAPDDNGGDVGSILSHDGPTGPEFKTTDTEQPEETSAPVVEDPVKEDPPKEDPKGEPKDEPKEEPPPDSKFVDVPEDPDPIEVKTDDKTFIEVTSPANGAEVDDKVVKFKGVAEAGAIVTTGDHGADVDKEGNWWISLSLAQGWNTFAFRAEDRAGNVAETEIKVYRFVPEEPPKPDWEFTANQKYGSCGEEIPYDVFWGTTKPETLVIVHSEFGAAETMSDKEGHWEVKVYFPDAPFGEEFKVWVESADHEKKFWFVRTGGHDGYPPDFSISSPGHGAEVDDAVVKFKGYTEPGATVTVGDLQAEVLGDGFWYIYLELELGWNDFTFRAVDGEGLATEQSIEVFRVEGWDFSAHQEWEVLDGYPDYNHYSGTTKPGATVTVSSPYGGGSTTADELGNWYLDVFYGEAPYGEPFTVTVSSMEQSKQFGLTVYLGEG